MSRREVLVASGIATGGATVTVGLWQIAVPAGLVFAGCMIMLLTLLVGVDVK